jgi:hypothetical protein
LRARPALAFALLSPTRRPSRRLLFGASLAAWLLAEPPAAAHKPVTLGIAFHVAEVEGRPVVEDAFIDERLEQANRTFEPYGVAFAKVSTVALGAEHAVLEDRADRDALGALVGRGAIDCFVVRSFRDVDDPTDLRRGVHWHSKTHPGAHFVILSTIGGRYVLAHELGHYLGNPEHSDASGNLLNRQLGAELPILNAVQLKKMERTLRGYLQRRELRPMGPNPTEAPARARTRLRSRAESSP